MTVLSRNCFQWEQGSFQFPSRLFPILSQIPTLYLIFVLFHGIPIPIWISIQMVTLVYSATLDLRVCTV